MKVSKIFKKIITHKYLALILRLYIGGIFIYAAISKISHLGDFAEVIADYQVLPYWIVNFVTIVLPWTELICGLLLVLGIQVRSSVLIIIGLLALFIITILINLFRGSAIDCGCFNNIEEPLNWGTLIRDLIWLLMAIHIYLFESPFQLVKGYGAGRSFLYSRR